MNRIALLLSMLLLCACESKPQDGQATGTAAGDYIKVDEMSGRRDMGGMIKGIEGLKNASFKLPRDVTTRTSNHPPDVVSFWERRADGTEASWTVTRQGEVSGENVKTRSSLDEKQLAGLDEALSKADLPLTQGDAVRPLGRCVDQPAIRVILGEGKARVGFATEMCADLDDATEAELIQRVSALKDTTSKLLSP